MYSASQPSTSSNPPQTAPQGLFAHSFGDLIHFLSRTIWPDSGSAPDAPSAPETEDAPPSYKYARHAGSARTPFIPTMSRSPPPTTVRVRDFAYEPSTLPPVPSVPRLRQQFQPSRAEKRNKLKRTRANYEDDTLPPDPDLRRTFYTDTNAMRPTSMGSYILDPSKLLKRQDTEPMNTEQDDSLLRQHLRMLGRGGPTTNTSVAHSSNDRSHGGFTRRLSRSQSRSSKSMEANGSQLPSDREGPQAVLLPARPRASAYNKRPATRHSDAVAGPSSALVTFARRTRKDKGKGRVGVVSKGARIPDSTTATSAHPPMPYNLRSRTSQTPSSEGSQVMPARRTRSSSRLAEALGNTSLSKRDPSSAPSREPGTPRKKRKTG